MNITVVFSVTKVIHSIPVKMAGIVAGIPIPFPLPANESNVCKSVKCPLHPHHIYTATFLFQMLQEYPPMQILIRLIFDDSTGAMIGCIQIPAGIK